MGAVFDINFSPLRLDELVSKLATEPVPPEEHVRLIVTCNLDHIVNLTRNAEFKKAYADAWATTADGAPISLYAKLRGSDLPGRVTGPDLFESLMYAFSPERHRPFFLVSKLATGEYLKNWLVQRGFDDAAVELVCPPFGFEREETYSKELIERIRNHSTTHLILGVGAPKSEVWVSKHKSMLGPCYAFGIGAGVDFFAGVERRAPRWMRRLGLEWVWRVGREPKRLSRRYFIDSWRFLLAVKRDLFAH
jgi:N-acetylglucosaminyldiphosphoundecaprenol N-acetyl-beta-D-mannosaminyltransferase